MIFLDANYLLRYLVQPTSGEATAMHRTAAAIFAAIGRRRVVATTSEAILAEVCFILASKRHYDRSPTQIASYLKPILWLPNLKLPRGHKTRYLRALEIWSSHADLGFVDALTAACVEHSPTQLATFDRDFDDLPGITFYAPQTSAEAA